ncbi:MAG: recombinase family protein [Clostridia bacterium]|nr:recombinase family protein [Clostridia bacterium]
MQNSINNNMEYYCAYLRKSRKDMDAEAHGQGETLARHEKRLKDYADSVGIKISKFYKEVVSGETISARPVMQQLLNDVENCMWTGVLVVEVERLARGNTLDQGIVSNAFQYSNTKIITPVKTYDPDNEFDEEYFEFGLFMSRREYKKINQRLHEGILSSVNEGKHVGTSAPYGYDKYKLPKQKGYSLKINEYESNMIKLIYNLYCSGNGLEFICNELNRLGYTPRRSNEFTKSTISHILTNPVYIGKIKYTDKATIKKVINGNIVRVKNENKNVIYVDGLHKPIIDLNTWNKVQNIRNGNLINRTKVDYTLKNPMASILKCGLCGRSLSRITYSDRNDVRICCRKCKENVGSNIDYVEDKLLQSLKLLLENYKIKLLNNDNSDIKMLLKINEDNILNSRNELEKLKLQLNKTYDLLEQEVYTKDIFIERSNLLKQQIEEINNNITKLEIEKEQIVVTKNNKEILIPKIEKVIDSYYETNNIKMKNELLKSVLEKVEYTKITPMNKDDFKLKLFPKIQA